MQLRVSNAPPPSDNQDLGVGNERPLPQLQQFLSTSSNEALVLKSASATEEAFFTCDLGTVVHQVQLWRQLLPRVFPFYAVKCNDDHHLLKLLAQLGLGFDCASKGEIGEILSLGVSPDRIIYANPCKQNSHVKYAAARDVDLMTFDSEGELMKIKKTHPNALLVLRISTDDSQSVCQLGMKFGAPLSRCKDMLTLAAQLQLNVVGVSFHVGSGCLDASAYDIALENAAQAFKIGISLGFDFTVLDIGGGFPGFEPTEENPSATFQEIAAVVNAGLDRHFNMWPHVTVIAEPGRFLAAAAFTLTTAVISVKPTPGQDCDDLMMCYINDGVYGSFNCLLYDHAKVTPIALKSCADRALYSVWGPSCDGLDKIRDSCELPADLAPGDWLKFHNMGAYTMAAASTFNGFPKPSVKYHISPNMLNIAENQVRKPFSVYLLAPTPTGDVGGEEDQEEREEAYLEELFVNQQLPVVSF